MAAVFDFSAPVSVQADANIYGICESIKASYLIEGELRNTLQHTYRRAPVQDVLGDFFRSAGYEWRFEGHVLHAYPRGTRIGLLDTKLDSVALKDINAYAAISTLLQQAKIRGADARSLFLTQDFRPVNLRATNISVKEAIRRILETDPSIFVGLTQRKSVIDHEVLLWKR